MFLIESINSWWSLDKFYVNRMSSLRATSNLLEDAVFFLGQGFFSFNFHAVSRIKHNNYKQRITITATHTSDTMCKKDSK